MQVNSSSILFTIYATISIYLIYKISKWFLSYIKMILVLNKLKGPFMIPFIGNALEAKDGPEFLNHITTLESNHRKEGIMRFWMGTQPTIWIFKPEYLDVLFSSSANTKKAFPYQFIKPWLGDGLLLSYGNKWSSRRRLITPTFHFEILNNFLNVMNEQAQILVDELAKLEKTKQEINIFKHIGLCALDIICETAMGHNVNAQIEKDSDYIKAVFLASKLMQSRVRQPWLWPDFIYYLTSDGKAYKKSLNTLHGFTRKVINERNSDFNLNQSQKRVAFLDILLKAKHEDNSLTFDDIQNEVDTFMFEGHDTTAAALSWAIHLIGSHPEVQKKLHEEIDFVFECVLKGHSKKHVTNDDLNALKYLDITIKESLRLYPSVPVLTREFTEDCHIAGYKIPKGVVGFVSPYLIHRCEKYYPNPEKFDPERFLPENAKDRHAFAYIPFSAGRRNCIGQRFAQMEEKVMLAYILRNFEIKSLKTTKEIIPTAEVILKPMNGIPVKLIPRN